MSQSTELAKTADKSLTARTADNLGFTREYVQTVKSIYAKDATDSELALFLQVSKRLGLDITARQIFMVRRGFGEHQSVTFQVSIDGLRLIADRTGRYAPGKETAYTYDKNGAVESATAYIKKHINNEWHEIAATAFFSEYCQRTRDGKPNAMWAKMPRTMIAKCAEALALRKAFPAELSGVYSDDEMAQAENPLPAPVASPPVIDNEPEAVTMAETISPKQLGYLQAKAKIIGVNLEAECQKMFNCPVNNLTKRAASALIKHLESLHLDKEIEAAKETVVEAEVVEESNNIDADEHQSNVEQIQFLLTQITQNLDDEAKTKILKTLLKGRIPDILTLESLLKALLKGRVPELMTLEAQRKLLAELDEVVTQIIEVSKNEEMIESEEVIF